MLDTSVTLAGGRTLAYTDIGAPRGPGARLVVVPGQGHVSLIRAIPQLCVDLFDAAKEAAA